MKSRDKLQFKDVKGHLFSKDKIDDEFGLDGKANRQVFILVT
ncbi:hypothetical protein Goshw_012200 [Gossypium schwendimanii]|uniref:Uncharacterized protein n=1 Tax=Gossypium schwendimanii TaxID=34291 RepID=A0A7J9KRM6_GOSSC|nr:hypothetical protein [Gossypium schwendimanii]